METKLMGRVSGSNVIEVVQLPKDETRWPKAFSTMTWVPVPEALEGNPATHLTFDGEAIADLTAYARFFIDESGMKHGADDGNGWQEIECSWADRLIKEDGLWRVMSKVDERLPKASAECARRIYAVADQTAQMNLVSAFAADVLSPDQKAAYRSGLSWIAEMRSHWRVLAADENADIFDNANWPSPSQDVVDLAAQF